MSHSDPSNDFQTRLLCQLLAKGVHFSASFALIAWLRTRFPGRFEAITKANELIMRDEGMHTQMACKLLRHHLDAGNTIKLLQLMVRQALKFEQEFIRDAFRGEKLFMMNQESFCLHVQVVADYWMVELGLDAIWNTPQPFDWLERSILESKTNFFETRVTEFQRLDRCAFTTEENF